MSIIAQFYASGLPGGAYKIDTLELRCSAWAEPIYICEGYTDLVCGTETGDVVTFLASAIRVALPKRNNEGNQSITVSIDNVLGTAQLRMDEARSSRQDVKLIYRRYLSTSWDAPADVRTLASVLSANIEGPQIQLNAGFKDLVNRAFNRAIFDTTFTPALRYL